MTRRMLLLSFSPALATGSEVPAGRWRSVTTTRGGIGAVYEFGPSGRGSYSSAALVTEPYTFAAGVLTMGQSRYGVGWHADGRMQWNDGQGTLLDFSPVGKPEAKSILGEWKTWTKQEVMGRVLPAIYIFQADGQSHFIIKIRTAPARVVAAGRDFRVEVQGFPTRKLRVIETGKRITITVPGGDDHEFVPI